MIYFTTDTNNSITHIILTIEPRRSKESSRSDRALRAGPPPLLFPRSENTGVVNKDTTRCQS